MLAHWSPFFLIALPFQLICRFSEAAFLGGVFHWFVYAYQRSVYYSVACRCTLFQIARKKSLSPSRVVLLRSQFRFHCCFIRILIGLRHASFGSLILAHLQRRHYVRHCNLAILLSHDLFLWPSRLMDWFGRQPCALKALQRWRASMG